jgi:hypothetical protein
MPYLPPLDAKSVFDISRSEWDRFDVLERSPGRLKHARTRPPEKELSLTNLFARSAALETPTSTQREFEVKRPTSGKEEGSGL